MYPATPRRRRWTSCSAGAGQAATGVAQVLEVLHTPDLQRTHVAQRGRASRRRRASGGRTSATAAPKQRPSCCDRVSSVHERTARTGAPSSSARAAPATWRAWPAPGRTTSRNRACGAVAARERSSRAAARAASSARAGASRTAAPGPRSTRLAARPSRSISRRGVPQHRLRHARAHRPADPRGGTLCGGQTPRPGGAAADA